jgi:hypothetical protein
VLYEVKENVLIEKEKEITWQEVINKFVSVGEDKRWSFDRATAQLEKDFPKVKDYVNNPDSAEAVDFHKALCGKVRQRQHEVENLKGKK